MPKIIDLFAGAGGLSLGAARAGFTLSGAVEFDERAMATHRRNFTKANHIQADVSKLTGKELLEKAGLKNGQLDGLIGGPPCQGFSSMGLRDELDPRNQLLSHFTRLVEETKPAFFLAENVPGILDKRFEAIVTSALDPIRTKYEVLEPFEVAANDYGAPTSRTRIIFFGYDPTRFNEINVEDFQQAKIDLQINVRTALHGLPVDISPDWIDEDSSWRKVKITKQGHFFERASGLIPDGVGEEEALRRHRERSEVHGCFGTRHSPALIERYDALCFGKTDRVSKARKLEPTGFCPTLRAGTGPDKGSHQAVRPIHYLRPRVITPREAARLQGFPDWFRFDNTKWHSFRQIGNSVSPFVAEALLLQAHSRLLG